MAMPEWDARELAFRFMALAYGVEAYDATAEDVVRSYAGAALERVDNGIPGAVPKPGDVISFDSASSTGHVAVVVWSSVGANGNGSVVVLSQNDTPNGWRTLPVLAWTVQGFEGDVPYAWLHDPAGRGLPQPQGSTVEGRADQEPPGPAGPRPSVPAPPAGTQRPPLVHAAS